MSTWPSKISWAECRKFISLSEQNVHIPAVFLSLLEHLGLFITLKSTPNKFYISTERLQRIPFFWLAFHLISQQGNTSRLLNRNKINSW